MRTLIADLKYALRIILTNPRFSLVAVAALALGIGANAAIFSVVNAVLLQPLPYRNPERLVEVYRRFPSGAAWSVSIPKFMAVRRAEAFESIAAYDFAGPGMNLGGGDRPEQVKGIHASADYFRVFGGTTEIGRAFSAQEDRPGGPHVVVLTHAVWKSRFGGDPGVAGRSIVLNGDPYLVVGVLIAGFRSDPAADVFIPLQADPNSTNHGNYLSIAARLKPGVDIQRARAELGVIGEQFRRDNPRWMSDGEQLGIEPLLERVVQDVRPALLILLGAVGLVLLIACANVASLLLARAAGRQKEMAIRAAIGAGRARIVRQLLTESVVLAAIGALIGLFAGISGARALLALSPGNLPRATELAEAPLLTMVLDWRMLGFTLALALVTGSVFGLAPALHLTHADVGATLKEGGGRGSSGARASRMRGALVVAEIALALVLLVGATLLIRTFISLRAVQPGFDPTNVLTMQTSLNGEKYASTREVDRLTRDVTQRIDAIPDVIASASTLSLPTEGGPDLPFTIEGRPLDGTSPYHGDENYRMISPGYFKVLSIPLLRGRLFTDRDVTGATPVLIINATMARKYWPNADPLGARITIGKGLGPEFDDPPRQIVGIVADVREDGLDRPAPAIMCVPTAQMSDVLRKLANAVVPTVWMVKASSDPRPLTAAIEKEFLTVDSLLPIARVRTMEEVVVHSIAGQNFNMLLLGIFGAIALLLAAVGIYGLMSYAVEQGTHDIGVRLALGADRRQILALIVGNGMRLAAIGLIVGVLAALGAVRVLGRMLFGVRPLDPLTFGIVVAVLGSIALLACYLPARRAMGVDPIVALRQE